MKKIILSLVLAFGMMPSAFAGWGATAYNASTGVASESHGYSCYDEAVAAALNACGGGCTIMNWEENSCVALATGNGGWGESHGYNNSNDAVNAAVSACGNGCAWQVWACN